MGGSSARATQAIGRETMAPAENERQEMARVPSGLGVGGCFVEVPGL